MSQIEIAPLQFDDISAIKAFMNQGFGQNFYSEKELEKVLEKSKAHGLNASFGARVAGSLAGVRLTYAPGTWTKGHRALSPHKWKIPENKAAYFKSLVVSEKFQKMGIGRSLSARSIEVLRQMGAQGILCHSWLESPGNSSQIYLQRMGFEQIQEHPNFWHEVDYECVRCGPRKCVCSAAEMIKYL